LLSKIPGILQNPHFQNFLQNKDSDSLLRRNSSSKFVLQKKKEERNSFYGLGARDVAALN